MIVLILSSALTACADTARLTSDRLMVEIDDETGTWSLLDRRSGARWPSEGRAAVGSVPWFQDRLTRTQSEDNVVRLAGKGGGAVAFLLADEGRALELRFEKPAQETIRILGDTLAVAGGGYVIVPSREGLLIPAQSDKAFKRVFGASEYEGCHMNMLGFVKDDSALIATWDDVYVFPEIERMVSGGPRLTTTFELRGGAASVRLMPLGKGDWNTIARAYRRYAEGRGLAVTLKDKIRRDPHVERMLGASNAKL